jgi:peroxiredoxin
MTLEVGQKVPPFTLRDRDRQEITQDSFPGKHLVMAFYALAFTGG